MQKNEAAKIHKAAMQEAAKQQQAIAKARAVFEKAEQRAEKAEAARLAKAAKRNPQAGAVKG